MALNINGGLTLNSGSLNTIQTPRTSVVYDSGLIFSASVDNVEILGNTFSVTSSIITLDTADATYNRVDAIVAELSSSVGPRITKITGTPSAEAAFPVLDPSNQIALKYVTVKANAVTASSAGTNPFDQETPEDYENIVIYNEGNGLPGEWNTGSVFFEDIPGNSFRSPEEAYVGSYSIKNFIGDKPTGALRGQHIAPQFNYSIADGNQIQLKRVAGFSFRIKLKTSIVASEPEFISQIQESGGPYSQGSSLSRDKRLLTYYGVNLNDTTNWQYVTFPIDNFSRKPYPSNPNNIVTALHLGVRSGRSITVIPDDAFVYIDDIRMHLGSLPIGDGSDGSTGTTGGTGVYKQGDTNYSIIPTNALSCVTNDFSTVGGGQNNTITGSQYSYIGAGQNNIIESGSDYISILGGAYNTASADYSSVIGGCSNTNQSNFGFIGGGCGNENLGNCSFIGSGKLNCVAGADSFIGGGSSNWAGGSQSVIVGGVSNFTNQYGFVGGGQSNCTFGRHTSIVGGKDNTITSAGCCGAILGGTGNCLCNSCSFIIGSNITSSANCTTFVNNLNVAGIVSGSTFSGSFVGDGSGLTNIPTSSIVNFPTEVSRSAAAAGFGSGGGGGSDSDWYDGTTYISSSVEIRVDGTISGSSNIIIGSGHTDNGTLSTLVGGSCNTICSNSSTSIILGGSRSCLSGSSSIIIGGAYNELHAGVSLIGGGSYNRIKRADGGLASTYSTIVGGLCNCILSPDKDALDNPIWGQFIGGGIQNRINTDGNGEYNSIVGGRANIISGSDAGCAFIGSGNANLISGSSANSAILGGQSNRIINHEKTFIVGSNLSSNKSCYTFMNNLDVEGTVSASIFSGSFVGDGSGLTNIGGGSSITLQDNGSSCTTALSLLNIVGATVTEPTADEITVTIGSGLYEAGTGACSIQPTIGSNTVAANSSSIAGGELNSISCVDSDSSHNFIGGGKCNLISGSFAGVIVGGGFNTLTTGSQSSVNIYDFIGGGNNNTAGGGFSSVVGGQNNEATGCASGVFGGTGNKALSCRSSILGGQNNTVNGSVNSSVLGGNCNCIVTSYVGDGFGEFILGGYLNLVSGSDAKCSTIIGGRGNTITHRNSHIIGGTGFISQAERTTYVENLHVTSSVDIPETVSSILTLSRRETTPTSPVEGMIMSSGSAGSSKLYYYDGSSWNALF